MAFKTVQWALTAIAIGFLGYQVAKSFDQTGEQAKMIAMLAFVFGGTGFILVEGLVYLRIARRSSREFKQLIEQYDAEAAAAKESIETHTS
ncbi:MAG: hypothetical protein AAGE65_05895 [Planctomycetota bacterium]